MSYQGKKDWHQLKNEDDKSYSMFLAYLEQGPKRTVKKACYAYTGSTTGLSNTWTTVSTDRRWSERAKAFDAAEAKQVFKHGRAVRKAVFQEILANAETLARQGVKEALKKNPSTAKMKAVLQMLSLIGVVPSKEPMQVHEAELDVTQATAIDLDLAPLDWQTATPEEQNAALSRVGGWSGGH